MLCCDWRAQTGHEGSGNLIGTDDAYKIKRLADDVHALIAGDPSEATELLAECRTAVKEFVAASEKAKGDDVDIVVSAFQRSLREAAGKRKEEIIKNYVRQRSGMTHEQLRQTPRHEFTEFHEHLWMEVRQLTLGADIILCALCCETPLIIKLDRFGKVSWVNNYCTVGTGAEVARGLLCLQPWAQEQIDGSLQLPGLAECIFRVFEAKQAAHIADPQSVGEATSLQILLPDMLGLVGLTRDFFAKIVNTFNSKHCVPEISSDLMDILGSGTPMKWRSK